MGSLWGTDGQDALPSVQGQARADPAQSEGESAPQEGATLLGGRDLCGASDPFYRPTHG